MAEPWVRVHANLADKPVITRAMEALGVSAHEAMGLLVQFWGAVSQHVSNGSVGGLPDSQLERWAGWTRKKGRFAAFIRAAHLDAEGRVNEWDDYAGRLEQRRATERDRLRQKRGVVAQQPPTNSAVVDQQLTSNLNGVAQQKTTLVPTRANETKRDETRRESTSSSPSPAESEEAAIAARLASDIDRHAFQTVLRMAPNRLTWALEMQASLDGMAGHTHVTPEQLGKALRDYSGNGATANPNLSHFRGYLESASKPPPARPTRNGGNRRPDDAPAAPASPYADAFKP